MSPEERERAETYLAASMRPYRERLALFLEAHPGAMVRESPWGRVIEIQLAGSPLVVDIERMRTLCQDALSMLDAGHPLATEEVHRSVELTTSDGDFEIVRVGRSSMFGLCLTTASADIEEGVLTVSMHSVWVPAHPMVLEAVREMLDANPVDDGGAA